MTCDFAPVSFHPMSPATANVNVSSAGLTSTLTGTANTVANTSPKTVKAIAEAYLIPANLHSRGHHPKALHEKTARGVCTPRDGTQRPPRHRAKGPMQHKHLVDTWRQSNTMRSRITGGPGPPTPPRPQLPPGLPRADPGPRPTRPQVVRLPSIGLVQVDQRNPSSGEDSRRSRRPSEEHRGRVPRPDPEADGGVDSSR